MRRPMPLGAGLLVEWEEIERIAQAESRTSDGWRSRGNSGAGRERAGDKPGGELSLLRRDLHDTVLQDVLCLSLGLSRINRMDMEPAAREEVAQLQDTARKTYDHLRELLDGRQQVESLPPRGMREVLTTCVRSFKRKTGADVQLQLNSQAESLAVSGEVAREAELIVHEALCNAWKHGRARSLKVVLSETADIIWVRVMDDGRGFDPSVRKRGHYGLLSMQERADAIGGRLGINSAPGKGTCVNLYLPSHHSATYTLKEGRADDNPIVGRG